MNRHIYKNRACLVLGVLILMPLMMSKPGYAADNLIFTGNLVAVPCTLRPGDEAITLSMSDISTRELYDNNRTVGKRFRIHLQGCDTNIADSVITTFSGRENMELPGLLALDAGSAAAGIALGMETPANVYLPLNTPSDAHTLSDGNNTLEFKAYVRGEPRALAEKSITAGVFTATSTFMLYYP